MELFFNQEPDRHIRACIWGPIKGGKTWQVSRLSNQVGFGPMLVMDTHRGSNFERKHMSEGSQCIQITSNVGMSAAVDRMLEYQNDKGRGDGFPPFKAVVVDTISDIWSRSMAGYDESKIGSKTVKSDKEDAGLIKQKQLNEWGTIKGTYGRTLHKLLRLNCHIFFIGWEGEEFKNNRPTGVMLPKVEKNTEKIMDVSVRLHVENGKRVFTPRFDRSNLIEKGMPADYMVFVKMVEELDKMPVRDIAENIKATAPDTIEKLKVSELLSCADCGEGITAGIARNTLSEIGKEVCWTCLEKAKK